MNSRKLYEFLELFNLEKKFKNRGTMTGRNRPKVARAWPSPAAKSASMAHTGQRSRAHARSPCAAPTGQRGGRRWLGRGGSSTLVAREWASIGWCVGKNRRAAAHHSGVSSMRQQKWVGRWWWPPVTLDSGGDLLQHRGRRGKVRRGPVEVEEAARVELT
jgi:hypothetical protein